MAITFKGTFYSAPFFLVLFEESCKVGLSHGHCTATPLFYRDCCYLNSSTEFIQEALFLRRSILYYVANYLLDWKKYFRRWNSVKLFHTTNWLKIYELSLNEKQRRMKFSQLFLKLCNIPAHSRASCAKLPLGWFFSFGLGLFFFLVVGGF